MEIARGMVHGATGQELPEPAVESGSLGLEAIHQELSAYRYCTVFVVEGEELDKDALEDQLEEIGDSLLVVGDPTALKVHVHTDDPGRALTLGTAVGAVEGVEIANMHVQTAQREGRLLESVPAAGLPMLETGSSPCARARKSAPVRKPRRHARDRGRSVDEPVGRGHPRGDRGGPDGHRARPSEQLERRPHRGAGSGAEREGRARYPLEVGAGRVCGDGEVRADVSPDENEQAMREELRRRLPERSRSRRATRPRRHRDP